MAFVKAEENIALPHKKEVIDRGYHGIIHTVEA
jgi:hypothetical protein